MSTRLISRIVLGGVGIPLIVCYSVDTLNHRRFDWVFSLILAATVTGLNLRRGWDKSKTGNTPEQPAA